MIATTFPRGITMLMPLRIGRRSYANESPEISTRFSWATGRPAPKSADSKPLLYHPAMKVLVIGASECFGHALLRVLCGSDVVQAVTGLDTRAQRFEHPKLRTVELDVRDPAASRALGGHDALVNIMSQVPAAANVPS